MAGGPTLEEVSASFAAAQLRDLPGVSIYDAIRRQAERFPQKLAVIDLPDARIDTVAATITYQALHAAIVQAANRMLALGLGAGDRILYVAPNCLAGLTGFWAAQLLGVVVPVNPFLDPAMIGDIARATGARAIMSAGREGADGSFDLARSLISIVPGLEFHLVLGGDAGENAVDLLAGQENRSDDAYLGRHPGLDDIAAYFPTGGTTGAPKIARLSHRNLLTGAFSSAVASTLDPAQVVPLGLPMFHVGGGGIASTRTLMLGQTMVILTPAAFRTPGLAENFWALADKYAFTQFISVPTVFADLLATYRGGGTTIRHFIAGASKLPASLCKSYENLFGSGIHEGYGMTETSGFCCVNPSALPARPGSGGITSPFYDVRVVLLDAQGRFARECEAGETGNIAISGPGVFEGYLDASQDAGKFIAGMPGSRWIDSGDLGRFDADGYLWVTGRDKDLIIRGGHNIDPAPIEETLLDHPDIVDAAAVGMPDARVGEMPVAFVQLAAGAQLDEAALKAFCQQRLPERAGTPVRIFALDALPRTAMRKIFKPELRRLAAQAAVTATLHDIPSTQDLVWRVLSDDRGCLAVEISGAPSGPDTVAKIEALLGPLNLKITYRETCS
ncbi:AMP-binding protein [Sphingobium chlorophenolicum]|uniref:O-succinylbenzoate--CoA ligase n=1 Tax=Sphingobium chlorophenolicum TaxID=46429 RepID=A0A081RB36_SPHCR|nr:AMP-binding protein [Sphingobium chlorophenolicum]KEQ52409.1 O-succinylbenzoate--CoA ligase [Sphingobium chlorophenolicum]